MANKTSKLTIVIAGKDQGAQKALKQTQTGVQGLGGAAKALGSQMAGAFSVGAIAAFGKKAISDASAYAGEVLKIQRLSGASAKDSSLLAFTAKNAGVEAGKAAQSYQILAKNIENGKVAAAGIVTKDANGNLLSFDQIVKNVADKMASLPPGVERTALALKVFGRGGADMVKILGKGSEALEAQRQKMESLGLEFTDANLAQQQRDIKGALLGVEVGIANGVLPRINQLSSALGSVPKGPFGNIAADVGYVSGALFDAISVVGPFVGVWHDLNDAYHEFSGVETPLTTAALRAVAKATKDAGIEAEDTGKKLGRLGRHYVGTSNAIKAAAAAEKSYADKKSLQNALEDVASAQDDLTPAPRASGGDWDEDRAAVAESSPALAEVLARRELRIDPGALPPWTHWVTPEVESKRYDVRFFVAAVPPGQRARDVSGEADQVLWTSPGAALGDYSRGQLPMLPPTVATLADLAALPDVATVLASASARNVRPLMPRPRLEDDGAIAWDVIDVRDGSVVVRLPAEPAGSEAAGA